MILCQLKRRVSWFIDRSVEQGKVQTPRVFYRREPDAQPLVVAKTGAK